MSTSILSSRHEGTLPKTSGALSWAAISSWYFSLQVLTALASWHCDLCLLNTHNSLGSVCIPPLYTAAWKSSLGSKLGQLCSPHLFALIPWFFQGSQSWLCCPMSVTQFFIYFVQFSTYLILFHLHHQSWKQKLLIFIWDVRLNLQCLALQVLILQLIKI